jgi:hypothetical protein
VEEIVGGSELEGKEYLPLESGRQNFVS